MYGFKEQDQSLFPPLFLPDTRFLCLIHRSLYPLVGLLVVAMSTVACTNSALPSVPGPILIKTNQAVAVVTTNPFRLQVGTSLRSLALSEVSNTSPPPTKLPPTIDPVPPGVPAQKSDQLYAPLSFLVGHETLTLNHSQVWEGNLQQGERYGIYYSARKVIASHKVSDGVSLTVSTDDPSGRTLKVVIEPVEGNLIHVSVTPHPAAGVVMMSDSFMSSPNEDFYGFGGRHNALNQHGNVLVNWVSEENVPGLGQPGTPSGILYPNGPTAAYYPQAQFISSAGYGFLLAQPQLSWFRLDSDLPNAWSVAASSSSLNYYVAPGNPRQAIAAITSLSGRQPVPPAWGLGPMFDREVKNFGETVSGYDSEMEQDIANIERYHLPLTAYRIEGFGFKNPNDDGFILPTRDTFPVQSQVVAELQALHIHPLAYIRPWLAPGSTACEEGLCVHTTAGKIYTTTGTLGQKIALLDFTNPAALRWWSSELDKIFNLGFDGFEQDFGEEVALGMHFYNGQTGASMHNEYPILYMKATRDAIDAYQSSHPTRHLWFDNRAGFSGTPGSARYEAANFPGDEATNWGQASGLASLTEDMLSRAIGGAYGYGTDIGGYSDYTTPPTTKQLFLRWAEWATLSPVFRLHGSAHYGLHTPWSYDNQTVAVYAELSALHEAAVPLILKLWQQADQTGIPPTRPLWLEFPGDPQAAAQTQEWTLGNDVLVAPVVIDGATSRSIYFPTGCWQDPQTGLVEQGPGNATVSAPLTSLPFFFRCGTHPFPVTGMKTSS
ncbi:MAG: hypothetical protein M1483_07635 [Actinobacteria bacterium]|nr:hypothetical protein [Actinomycetota bacterium]MCL6105480.1 hypothetical protein [Actinomycetota bacterium]